jgi:hypothetical protein
MRSHVCVDAIGLDRRLAASYDRTRNLDGGVRHRLDGLDEPEDHDAVSQTATSPVPVETSLRTVRTDVRSVRRSTRSSMSKTVASPTDTRGYVDVRRHDGKPRIRVPPQHRRQEKQEGSHAYESQADREVLCGAGRRV